MKKSVLFAVLIAFGAPGVGVLGGEAKPDGTSWKISGDLEEACSCSAACPCWFGSKPTQMNCGGVQALFIDKGKYGGVVLDGLAVVNVAQSPDGESMMDSFGHWDFSYLYVDEKASPAQRKALEAIGKTVLPMAGSTKTEVRHVPIKRVISGKEHEVTVGEFGGFAGHLVEGGLGGPAKIVNPPGADPLHHEYAQGMATKLAYTDAGQNWNRKDSNYMLGRFSVDSVQYKKFAAGLAQKMEAMKKEKKAAE